MIRKAWSGIFLGSKREMPDNASGLPGNTVHAVRHVRNVNVAYADYAAQQIPTSFPLLDGSS